MALNRVSSKWSVQSWLQLQRRATSNYQKKYIQGAKSDWNLEKKRELLKDHIPAFPKIYPDFLESVVWSRRDPDFDELEKHEMMERRMHLDVPEFYVGSIVAVTTSEPSLGSKDHRFVGICIRRMKHGMQHNFTLRNVIEGIGVEVMYDLYNPTIKKIETLKLEKRLDDELSYLIDALPEYSTFDFNMEPHSHPAGTPVPINPLKVKMKPPPWSRRWDQLGPKGVEDVWTQQTAWFKRKFHKSWNTDFEKYDIIADYRIGPNLDYELQMEERMKRFEKERHEANLSKKRILKSVADAK
ncbi:hypothetical protein WR25_04565 [Diploscapter pachys]|uniref:Large ribosomal subunit protein bL19m n=1 Tax=Diploscapter pachys TaxID=2018661 RepID=A0A2A2JG73_9BILA|nr:hypothetical protein WR25_04565 [Diploscapter pachys]